jgi:toxin HigB-1
VSIASIRHKGLRELFETGRSARLGARFQDRSRVILDFLDGISSLADCEGVKGFHPLRGDQRGRYAMSVSGNYRITFAWDGANVTDVDFEDYH